MAGMWKIPTFAEDQRERVRGWEARLDARALAEPVTDEPEHRLHLGHAEGGPGALLPPRALRPGGLGVAAGEY